MVWAPKAPRWVYADTQGSDGWRTLRPPPNLSVFGALDPVFKQTDCLAIADLPLIVSFDLRYNWFYVGERHVCSMDGLAQGSHASAGVANRYACVREEKFLRNLPVAVRAVVDNDLCAVGL